MLRTERIKSVPPVVFGLVGALFVATALMPWPEATAASGLQARIFLTQKGISSKLTEQGLLKFAKQNSSLRLKESGDGPLHSRYWRATMVATFNRVIDDLELGLLFYDIEGASPKFVRPMTVYLNRRDLRTVKYKFKMMRSEFEANRRMEMVMTVRRQEVARQRFQILGERVKRSGTVSFSEEEVN